MAIAVNRLMDAKVLQGAHVIAGRDGLHHLVESVNMMDAPDIGEWIRPNQMLVTTLYNLKDNLEGLKRLIPELADRGCSALGIKSRYLSTIPSFMIDQANALALPLIALPHDPPLGVLSHEITRTLLARDLPSLDLDTDSLRVWDAVMGENGMQSVASYLSRQWQASLALYGQDRQLLAVAISGTDPANFQRLITEAMPILGRFHRLDAHACTIRGHRIERMPLIDHHCYYGDIVVIDRAQSMGHTLKVGIQAASAFCLKNYLARQHWRDYLQHRLRTWFQQGLNSNLPPDDNNPGRFLIDASDFMKATTYGVMIAHVERVEDPQRLGNHWHPMESLKDDVLIRIDTILQNKGFLVASAVVDGDLVFVVAGNSALRVDNLTVRQRFIRELDHIVSLLTQSYSIHIRCAIGAFYSSAHHVPHSYQEARETLKKSQNKIAMFQPQTVQNFLQHIPLDERKRFVQSALGALLALPSLEREPLLKTLQLYLIHQNQVTETAQVLYVHRNTVVYRLRKIEQLLGKSLDNADDVLTLRLALLFFPDIEGIARGGSEPSYHLADC